MFKEMFGKQAEQPKAPAAEKMKATTPVDPSKLGTIETPFRGGDNVKALKLPESVFVGSQARQRQVELDAERYNRPDMLSSLHSAELSTEFPDAKGEITAKREFTYVQTPDGRLHSSSANFETVKGDKKETIQESRNFAPEGQVLSNRRVEKKADGSQEVGEERLAYKEENGTLFVAAREYTKSVNGEVVYRTETTPDPDDMNKTITVVTLDKSGRSKPGEKISHSDIGRFKNGYGSDMLKLLED